MTVFFGFLFIPFFVQILAVSNFTENYPNATDPNVDIAADLLFDEYWQMYLEDNPEFATSIGVHRYDDKLKSCTLKSYEERKERMTEFVKRAKELMALAQEGSETHYNLQLFTMMLEQKIENIMSGSYFFPISNLYTPEKALRHLLKYIQLKSAEECWDLIARNRAFPQQIDDQIELMREGIRTNMTLHERSLWKAKHAEFNESIDESPFYKPFLNIESIGITDMEKEYILINATDSVMHSILPALRKLDDFVENEYRPNARPEIGVSSLPNGKEFYGHELAYHLSDSGVTAEEIHAMGMEEVRRISEEMVQIIHGLNLSMTQQEFSDQLRNDESQFFSSEEEALETYRTMIKDVIYPKLPLLFKTIPQKLLTVEKIPTEISGGPRAYYNLAAPDNSTPGTFFLDTSSIKNLPRYEVVTLAMHEGVPGHHFQNSYTMEQKDVPEFRKHGLRNTAYTEGWALYAEHLGYELGLYDDPYMRYGHLSEEIFRACRMVVDTGMHMFGWSRQRAIDYMLRYSAATLENIEREVDRYITWPGQACSYKYGELKIKELRHRAETALGSKFDVKEFHDVILRSKGPFALIEKQVDYYILSQNSTETV